LGNEKYQTVGDALTTQCVFASVTKITCKFV
jgi:hypothetical protein